MSEIKNLTTQLEIIGADGNFDDVIVFHNKRDLDDNIILGVSSSSNQITLFSTNSKGVQISVLNTFTFSDVKAPSSTNISDLVEKINAFIHGSVTAAATTESIIGEIITPPLLTANVDDYEPTGFETIGVIRQDLDANNRSISGFPAPAADDDRIIGVCNINTSGFDLKFFHNDAGSLEANRILLRDAANKAIKPNETAWFWYDHISERWRPHNRIG